MLGGLFVALVSCGEDTAAISSPAEVGGAPDRRVVFVTGERLTGDLGGVEGADALCQANATAAGLVGRYGAWLSTPTSDPADDAANTRYVRTDGVVIAESLADLLDGSLAAPIALDATAAPQGGDVWTGTLASGARAQDTCDGWTAGDSSVRGQCGSTAFTDRRWTENLVPNCGIQLRVFCFER